MWMDINNIRHIIGINHYEELRNRSKNSKYSPCEKVNQKLYSVTGKTEIFGNFNLLNGTTTTKDTPLINHLLSINQPTNQPHSKVWTASSMLPPPPHLSCKDVFFSTLPSVSLSTLSTLLCPFMLVSSTQQHSASASIINQYQSVNHPP
jgi:hypothetical protein